MKHNKILSVLLSALLLFTVFIPATNVFADNLLSSGVKTEYNGHTYIRVDSPMTWQAAKVYCEQNGGYLATVTSFEEQTVLMRLIQDGGKDQYWLGATDEAEEGSWQWVTGEVWGYRFTGELDNHSGIEDYLQMLKTSLGGSGDDLGRWNDCSNNNYVDDNDFFGADTVGFIYEAGEPVTFVQGKDYMVNGDVASYRWHTYTLIEQAMTWQEADAYCKSRGGYLATVTSAREQQVITDLIKNGKTKGMYWLGGTDAEEEGVWKWSNGETFNYLNPNYYFDNAHNDEHYLQIQRTPINGKAVGHWNDANNNNTSQETYYYYPGNVGFILETGEPFTQAQNDEGVTVPIVYVIGRTTVFNAKGQVAVSSNTSFITDVVTNSMDELKHALLTGQWDAYCDLIYNELSAKFADYRLNNEGEIDNGSGIHFGWSMNSIPVSQKNMYSYQYQYDARLDPCDIADDLNHYIEAVKIRTGSSKVHLVSRCLGCNIVSAYLAEYGYEDVLTNVFYASAAKGYDYIGEMFAGKFDFDDDAVSRYVDEDIVIGDEFLSEFLKATAVYADECGILDIGTLIGKQMFNKVAEKILPQLILATYGTCPGYWSMVNDENYEDAKKTVFGDEADTTYKTLVSKIDNYHYNVMNQLDSTLVAMKNNGVKINIICKYGFQVPPFIESANQIGDDHIEVSEQSFGATCMDMEDNFNLLYLNKAKRNGTLKYISPEKQIDSSTALFPDATWYVKDYRHGPFYDCFHVLLQEMCFSKTQMTVESDALYPQYLLYNENNSTFEPLTEENMNTFTFNKNFFTALARFFKALFAYLKSL